SHAPRAGKADCLDRGMLYQRLSYGGSAADEEREYALWQALVRDGLLDHAANELRRARVRGVRFGDHRTARGEGRCGVSACDGKRQREVACAEDRDGTDGNLLRAQIGARHRLA